MKIYLDNCSFNRPFDDQKQIRIKIETEAKLYIQEKVKRNKIKLVWLYILNFENNANPYEERKIQIAKWKKYAEKNIVENEEVLRFAEKINLFGIQPKDCLHLACAIEAKCDYFITTDDHLLKKNAKFSEISIVSPTKFIEII